MGRGLLFTFLTLFSIHLFSQLGPGGVSLEQTGDSNNKVWLDAGKIALPDGAMVAHWQDLSHSVNDNSPTQTNDILKPILRSDISAGINGKPVLRFGNGKMLLFVTKDDINNNGPYTERTTFIALRTGADVTTRQMIYEQGGNVRGLNIFIYNGELYMGGYDRANDPDGTPLWGYTYTRTPIAPKTTYVISHVFNAPIGSTTGEITGYLNGMPFGSVAPNVGSLWTHPNAPGLGAINSDSYNENGQISNATSQQPFLGDIAEMIAYDEVLNNAERIIVENYLGAKYHSNIIINDKYDHQLFYGDELIGIGQESGVSNRHNVSQGRNCYEIKADASAFDDNDFLLLGCDNKDNTVWTDAGAPNNGVNTKRLERVWRADHNGDLGSITFTLDASKVPSMPFGFSKYVLIVDRTGGLAPNFNNGNTDVIELVNVGGSLYEASTTVEDGAYLTFGVIKPTIEFALDHDYGFEADVDIVADVEVTLNYITTSGPVVFAYEFFDNTATNPVDYVGVNAVSNIPNGQQSNNINLSITGDLTNENTETFTISLVDGMGIPFDSHTFYIYDNDHTPKLKFDVLNSTVNENANNILVDVVRTGDNSLVSSCDYRLRISGGSGTADLNQDFTITTGSLVFGVGENIKQVPLTIIDDVYDEYDETIILEIYNVSVGSDFETAYVEHEITIVDNDAVPAVQFVLANKENYESVGLPQVKLQLSNKSQKDITVEYSLLASSTATQSLDHTLASSGIIGFPAGDSIAYLPMIIINDGFQEPDETIEVELLNNANLVNVSLGATDQHTYTIIDYESFEHTGVGGVGTLPDDVIWLFADTVPGPHGFTVGNWVDLSPNGHSAMQSNNSKRPKLQVSSSLINGFKTMAFDGSNDYLDIVNSPRINQGTYESKYIFLVIKTGANVTSHQTLFEQGGGTRGINIYIKNGSLYFHAYNTANDDAGATTPWGGSGGSSKYISGSVNANTEYIVSFIYDYNATNQLEGFINGVSQGAFSDGSIGRLFSHADSHIGGNPSSTRFHDGNASGKYFNGNIAEFLYLSNAPLNPARRVILETYFSGKYDINLGVDYYSSPTHKYGIAGIGKHDVNSDHIDSQGPESIVRINSPSALSNGDYLFWGHDNQSFNNLNTTNVPMGTDNRMDRSWYVKETLGSKSASGVGTVTLSFDLAGFTITSPTHLELLIDDDGDFSDAVSHTIGRTFNSSSQVVSFSDVDLSDGNYFTIGSTSRQTPLPVELISFEAEEKTSSVILNWQTSSEINNDYFYVEKTIDGTSFEFVGQIEGAGSSNQLNQYELFDDNPYSGLSYYRLAQVDYDGTLTYSKLESVMFETENSNQLEFTLYPNPVRSISEAKVQLRGVLPNTSVDLTLFDALGNSIYSEQIFVLTNSDLTFSLENIKDLDTGIYVLKLTSGTNTKSQKVIIKK